MKRPTIASGRLRKSLLPAVYLESSALVDYWSAEGIETAHHDEGLLTPDSLHEYNEAVRDLFKYSSRLELMADVREVILSGATSLTAVTTPLAVLELAEWHARANFKQIASDAVGHICVERMSRKSVGDSLAKVYREGVELVENSDAPHRASAAPQVALTRDCMLDTSYMAAHGLRGVLDVEIRGLSIDKKEFGGNLLTLAYHQVGLADLLHVAAASHLGCRYFAAFDSDFRRCRSFLKEVFGLDLVSSPEELLRLLKANV